MTKSPIPPHLVTLAESLALCAASPPSTAQQDSSAARRWREANRPLVDRLRDLLATIPPEVQRGGLALRDLQPRLAGRGRGTQCDHAELGAALRSLGFRRVRSWSPAEEGFRALWMRDI